MLKRFEVIGYKNFKDRFHLDLSKICDYKFNVEAINDNLVNTAIIYGKNAVGKTNFGLALFDIKENILMNEHRVFDSSFINADTDRTTAEFVYEFQFDKDNVKYKY